MSAAIALWAAVLGQRSACVGVLPVSTDGTRYLCWSDVNTDLTLRDSITGHAVQTFRGSIAAVRQGFISPDGQRVAGTSPYGETNLWDVKTGRLIQTILPVCRDVYWSPLAFDASSRLIATANVLPTGPVDYPDQGVICVFDTRDGHLVACMRTEPNERYELLQFAPGSQRLWAASGTLLREFDVARKREIVSRTAILGVTAMTPDGRFAVSTYPWLAVWNTTTRKRVIRLDPTWARGDRPVPAISPDGRTLVVALNRMRQAGCIVFNVARLQAFDVVTGRVLWARPESISDSAVRFSADSSRILVGSRWVVEARSGRSISTFPLGSLPVLAADGSVTLASPPN